VRATVNGATRLYIGDHYEVDPATGAVRKDYRAASPERSAGDFAAGQRVAMREAGALAFLPGDHLSSTSVTVDTAGAVLGEHRPLPLHPLPAQPRSARRQAAPRR
jgi:hypothetical protein